MAGLDVREIRLSSAAWLVLFGVLTLAGCGGGGCGDDCPAPPDMGPPARVACTASHPGCVA